MHAPSDNHSQLDQYRLSIDHLDTLLIYLLSERTRTLIQVGRLKKQLQLPQHYTQARLDDMQTIKQAITKRQLNIEFIEQLYAAMFDYARELIDTDLTLPPESNSSLSQTAMTEKQTQLQDHRHSLYNLDMALYHVLAERFHIVRHVGHYKANTHLPPLDSARWQQIIEKRTALAEQLGIDIEFIKRLFNIMHDYSLMLEKQIIENATHAKGE